MQEDRTGSDGPRLSRRAVVRGGVLLGAAAAAPVSAAGEDTPTRGGTLRLGLGGGSTTDSLDPLRADDSVMIATTLALYNSLVENSASNRPIPELAERFEARPGAATWVLDLRRDVVFHNGKTFEADDAIYSLNLHRGDSRSGASGPMKAVTEIRKLDRHQIEVRLVSGDADFPTLLSDYHIVMVPEGFEDWTRPLGTGAFTAERYEPGSRIALKKAGGYWKAGRGHLDGVDITVINDTSARMTALIAGRVDAINRADPRTVSRIEKSPVLDIVRAAGGWFPTMAMQVDRDPYRDPAVRQALKYAVDRETMVKVLFSGYGTLGNDHPIPRSDPAWNSALPQRPYDPEKARFHFARAGIANPKILLQTSEAAFNGAIDMASQFQETAERCGIPVEIRNEPSDGYFNTVWLKGAFVASYWGGRPAATQMLSLAYAAGAPWNETHWRDQGFDTALAAAKAETDDAKRKTILWDLQAMLSSDGGSLIPCFRDWLDAHHKRVGGHTPHSGFDMDNGRIAEKAFLRE